MSVSSGKTARSHSRVGRPAQRVDDQRRVAVEVADRRVELAQRDPEAAHGARVPSGRRAGPNGADASPRAPAAAGRP